MGDAHARPERWSEAIFLALKTLVVTVVAAVYWIIGTSVAVVLVSAFAAAWYVFFGLAVFGDFLGIIGSGGPALARTTGTMIFVGAMTLTVVLCCGLIVRIWNDWQHRLLQKRRMWLD